MRIIYNDDPKKINYNAILIVNPMAKKFWIADEKHHGVSSVDKTYHHIHIMGRLTLNEVRYFLKFPSEDIIEKMFSMVKVYRDIEKMMNFF